MELDHLPALADQLLAAAREAASGRAAQSIRSGRDVQLRQTVMALTRGHGLDDHVAPGEATLQVLVGRVALRWSREEQAIELAAGDWIDLPDARHALDAETDAVVLLTVSVRQR
ncbi:cupin domain-containing protein [Agrococcus baldri]|nr:cupin domain-containing protein [Agrococcus baldri]